MENKFAEETTSSIWTKKNFQEMRKDFKAQGFDIKKTADGNGYELKIGDLLLLKAMNGSSGYLVTHVKTLFA